MRRTIVVLGIIGLIGFVGFRTLFGGQTAFWHHSMALIFGTDCTHGPGEMGMLTLGANA